MILQLVKRDPAWQMALMLAVVLAVAAPLSPSDRTGMNALLFGTVAILACSVQARSHIRATLFEAALPIDGRDLFRARILSLMALVWLPVFCGVSAILLLKDDGSRAVALLEAAAILTPAILLPQAMGVREIAARSWWARWAGAPIAILGGVAWYFLPAGVVLGMAGAVTAAIVYSAWVAVPASFQVAPLEAADPVAPSDSVPDVAAARLAFRWLPALRSAFWRAPVMYFVSLVMLGVFGTWWAFFPIFVVQATLDSRRRTSWLAALPLSSRRLLAISLAASVLPLVAGVGIGMCFSPMVRPPDTSMWAGPKLPGSHPANVALEFWRYSPSGAVPAIQAPWGEAVEVATFRTLGFTFYNPYSVGAGNSRQLREWQFERSTKAVYGRSIPLSQFGAAQEAGLTPVTGRPLMRMLTWEAAVLSALYLVFVTGAFQGRLLGRFPALRATVLTVLVGIPVVAYGGTVYYLTLRSVNLGEAVFHWLLLDLTGAVRNALLALAVGAVPVAGMYWLLEWQFRRTEASTWKEAKQAGF